MYFETVACETATPSFSSSPWILGAPQRGLASLIRRIRSRSSLPIGPTLSPPTLPRPVASEPLPVPAHHGRWPHHTQRILPVPFRTSPAPPRRSDPEPSAAAAADALSTRRVAAAAPGSPTPTLGACEQCFALSPKGC